MGVRFAEGFTLRSPNFFPPSQGACLQAIRGCDKELKQHVGQEEGVNLSNVGLLKVVVQSHLQYIVRNKCYGVSTQ